MVGDPSAPETTALWSAAYRTYRPDKLAVRLDPQREAPAGPLFAGRTLVEGRPGAYVCRDFVCQRPVTEPAELARELR